MKIEMINSFNIGDLIGLVGVILGIIGTYIIATISERRLNRKEKKEKRPLLVIGTTEVENVNLHLGNDFIDNDLRLKDISGAFSHFSIPLVNLGITPVTSIHYYCEIKNFDEIQKYLNQSPYKNNFRFEHIGHDEDGDELFQLWRKYEDNSGSIYWFNFKSRKYTRSISHLKPSGEEEVYFQKDICVILESYLFDTTNNMPKPEIYSYVFYYDYLNIFRKDTFTITIESLHTTFKDDTSNLSFRLVGKNMKSEILSKVNILSLIKNILQLVSAHFKKWNK